MFAELFSYDNELRAEGEAIGEARGMEKGIAKGEHENALRVASQMKNDGIPLDLIIKYSGLSESQINAL